MRFGLPRERRLRKRSEFLVVQAGGKKLQARHFIVLVMAGRGRLGITVSKKVGNAVTRNRIKRSVREFVRLARDGAGAWLPADRDVVVIAKPSAARMGAREVAADLATLGGRL